MKDLTRICASDVANVGQDISRLRGFVDGAYAQFALLGVQLMWTTDVQTALEQVKLVTSGSTVNSACIHRCSGPLSHLSLYKSQP